MKQDMYMLPVRCKGCNTMFDLWPVLQEQEQASQVALADSHFAKLLKQSFCRNCRKAVLLGMAGEQKELEFEDNQEEVEGTEESELSGTGGELDEVMLEIE